MKTLLFSLLTLVLTLTADAQLIGNSATFRGDYFGILIPSARCSNERLGVDITMNSDGHLWGSVRNWENSTNLNFTCDWPFFDKGRFLTDITRLNDYVSGKASAGAIRGTAVLGGCKYTFVAYRRYKVAQ